MVMLNLFDLICGFCIVDSEEWRDDVYYLVDW